MFFCLSHFIPFLTRAVQTEVHMIKINKRKSISEEAQHCYNHRGWGENN